MEKEFTEAWTMKTYEEAERIKREEEKKQRKLKNAPDKAILLEISKRIAEFQNSFPEVKGTEAKSIIAQTEEYLKKISQYIIDQAEFLTK